MFPALSAPAKATIFYIIAFILVFAIAASGIFGEASPPVSMLTSLTSVILMMLVVTREGWSQKGWRSLGLLTTGLRGWWIAILVPAACLVFSDAVLIMMGLASLHNPEGGKSALQMVANISIGLLISIGLAFCEEIGWRGYMLPRLLGLGAVSAVFMVGFLHGVWHLPLMLMTPYYHPGANPMILVPLFLVTLTLAGVFFGFLRLWTGSVWPAAIAHGVYNLVWGLGSKLITADRPATMEYIGGESGVLVIAVLIIAAFVLIPKLRAYSQTAFA